MMRIKDKLGSWKESTKDPRVMTKRLPTDVDGTYYHIYPEGEIVNYDGSNVYLAPNKWGLDFNRNFPFAWFSEVTQPGAGQYPLSNTETKTMADFILSKKNIGFVNALHTTGGVFIYPPGTYSEKNASPLDMKIYKDLGKVAKKKTGYETKNVFDEFLSDNKNYSSGAFDDWCYETQGIPSFTIELWDLLLRSGVKYEDIRLGYKDNDKGEKAYVKALSWIESNLGEDYFTAWQPYNHPQLGEVEIGGFDFRFTIMNPPEKFLFQEVEKIGEYLIESALALPKIEISKINTKQIENNVYKVDIYVSNKGYMSTNLTQKSIELKTNKEVMVKLNQKDIYDNDKVSLNNLSGYGEVNTNYAYSGIQTLGKNNQTKKASFILKKESSNLECTVSHPIAGEIKQVINFKK